MEGIRISKGLKSKLPEEQRNDVEERLWDQSGGVCYLCGEPLNRSSDQIVADHDEAEIEGGETTVENLNLVHRGCNSAKRNSPTVDVKPYLRLQAFIKKHEGSVRYGECATHFGISPKPSVVTDNGDHLSVELPDGSIAVTPVFSGVNLEGGFRYAFVNVPRAALYNDDDCQPRNIKLSQVWAIYTDLQKNPLHEPPGCRLLADGGGRVRFAMFDGQHKTVASWMSGHPSVVVKLYLDISLQQTIRLVNSVQAKIKKLPLSPFEIAAKLADEWRGQFELYEDEVGSENVSEKGFVEWLKPNDRRRGKQAFEEARIQRILDKEELALLRFIKRGAAASRDESLIPEAAFKSKLLKEMVSPKLLTVMGPEGELLRTREAENIIKVLNYFSSKVFEPNGEGIALDEEQKEVRRRFTYQAALKFVGEMLPKIVGNICLKESDTAFLDASFSDAQWEKVGQAVDRLVEHPVWIKEFKIGSKTRAVEEALIKNQGAKEALAAAGLTFGYVVGGERLAGDWYV